MAKSKKSATKPSKKKVKLKSSVKVKTTPKKAAPKKAMSKKTVSKKATPKKVTPKKATSKASKKPITKNSKSPAKTKAVASVKASGSASKLKFQQFFTPIEDRVVVEFSAPAEKTAGGLYIPQTVTDRPNQGLVVAVGIGCLDKKGRRKNLDVKVGETVLFSNYAGSKMELNGHEYLILREGDILGIVDVKAN